MITATAASDALIQRMSARAARLGEGRGKLVTKIRNRGQTNWRSASSLWPDLDLPQP